MRFGNASVRDVCILDHLHLDAVLPQIFDCVFDSPSLWKMTTVPFTSAALRGGHAPHRLSKKCKSHSKKVKNRIKYRV